MSKVNTIEIHVPYVPGSVDYALVAAKPLAASLAAAAPEFRNVRRVKFAKLQPIERDILKQCESTAAAARARIHLHLSKIDELFAAVQTSIKLSGKHLELIQNLYLLGSAADCLGEWAAEQKYQKM
jgi:hypothetical protein